MTPDKALQALRAITDDRDTFPSEALEFDQLIAQETTPTGFLYRPLTRAEAEVLVGQFQAATTFFADQVEQAREALTAARAEYAEHEAAGRTGLEWPDPVRKRVNDAQDRLEQQEFAQMFAAGVSGFLAGQMQGFRLGLEVAASMATEPHKWSDTGAPVHQVTRLITDDQYLFTRLQHLMKEKEPLAESKG